MRRLVTLLATGALVTGGLATTATAHPGAPGPHSSYGITRDAQGIVHIRARSLLGVEGGLWLVGGEDV